MSGPGTATVGPLERAFAAVLDGPLGRAPIAALDRLRRRWLRALGGLARPLVRDRELRVAAMFSLMIVTALVGSLVAPLWLLLLGPLIWGVPHLVADLRYLVLETGYHRRRGLALVGAATLGWIALGGDLLWGFVGAAAIALVARAGAGRRLVAAALLLACGALLYPLGYLSDVIFGHVHNFVAVALWWVWCPRRGRLHWIPLALLVAATLLLLSPLAPALVAASGGLRWFASGTGADYELARLAPGVAPELGLRLVLLFCFAQSIHYGIWLQLLADDARGRATPATFRRSLAELRAVVGDAGVVVAGLLAVSVAVWAAFDLTAANNGYFRVARFHGHLEIMALTLLLLEGRRRATADAPR
ncbi:MAG: hypothetical protein R3A79_26325 [Nannocystaceae bacterium]